MAAAKIFLPLKKPSSICCNSGTDNDIELNFGDFSYLMDIFMCTTNEQILRWWVTKLKFLYCFEME